MQKGRKGEEEKRREGERTSSFRLLFSSSPLLLFSLSLCGAAGCESGFGSRQQSDPLLGIHAAPKPLEQSSAPSNALAQATSGPIPAMPSSYSAPSTAPVAGGETATPEHPRDLRMAGSSTSPANAPSAGAARGTAPVVSVGNPEPAPAAAAAASLTNQPIPLPGGSAATIRTYEDAQQFLKQQRVSWQRLDMEDGQWKFECGVPNPSNPQINRHYATSRAFPDPLSAIREVITQIEKKGP
jgi:hypothetical protein